MKTEPAIGWGIKSKRNGENYLHYFKFAPTKGSLALAYSESLCHGRPVRVALVPLAEWKRLKRLEKEVNGKAD